MSKEEDVKAALRLFSCSHHVTARSAFEANALSSPSEMTAFSAVGKSIAELHPWASAEGIAGLGVAEKVTHGKRLSEIALKVYVEKKLPLSKVEHPVPPTLDLAGLPSIDTDVVEVGRIELHSNTRRIRPAIPGYSIGRAIDVKEAGTFGMLVRKKGKTSPYYLLTNSHAIAASGFANKGDVIIQPGGADGGNQQVDAIGTLAEWVPFEFSDTGFNNMVDAAIAVVDDKLVSAAIAQLGVPKGVNTEIMRGDYVQKAGRTTALSVARVMDVDLMVPSTYPDANGQLGRVGFSDQVLVTFYSAPGDSGSPVLNVKNEVVGLHVAGSPVIGIFCKIANIMKSLDIEVVTQENIGNGLGANAAA